MRFYRADTVMTALILFVISGIVELICLFYELQAWAYSSVLIYSARHSSVSSFLR